MQTNHDGDFFTWMQGSVIQVNGTFDSWSSPRVQSKAALRALAALKLGSPQEARLLLKGSEGLGTDSSPERLFRGFWSTENHPPQPYPRASGKTGMSQGLCWAAPDTSPWEVTQLGRSTWEKDMSPSFLQSRTSCPLPEGLQARMAGTKRSFGESRTQDYSWHVMVITRQGLYPLS